MDKWNKMSWGSRLVLWMGLLLIGILAVPTGILIALISLVGSATGKMLQFTARESANCNASGTLKAACGGRPEVRNRRFAGSDAMQRSARLREKRLE